MDMVGGLVQLPPFAAVVCSALMHWSAMGQGDRAAGDVWELQEAAVRGLLAWKPRCLPSQR